MTCITFNNIRHRIELTAFQSFMDKFYSGELFQTFKERMPPMLDKLFKYTRKEVKQFNSVLETN